jgi:hypothetical protein
VQELFGQCELGILSTVVSWDLTDSSLPIQAYIPWHILNPPHPLHPLRLNSLNVAWIVALLLYPLCLFLSGAWFYHKVTASAEAPDGHYVCARCRQLGITTPAMTGAPAAPDQGEQGCFHCKPTEQRYFELADMENPGSPEVINIAPSLAAPPQQPGMNPKGGYAYFPSLPFFFPFSTITVELSPPKDHNGHANDCWEGFACKRDSCM